MGMPVLEGDYALGPDSPCLAENSPCGERIGSLGVGCGIPGTGACCLDDRECRIMREEECLAGFGRYQGDGVLCEPDPCGETRVEESTWGRIKARYAR